MVAFDGRKVLSELYHINTFASWPKNFAISKASLVAAGFCYLLKDDLVKCAYCSLELEDWKERDDPMNDHERWSPRCPFVEAVRAANGNVTIVQRVRNDECGFYRTEVRPHSRAQKGNQSIFLLNI